MKSGLLRSVIVVNLLRIALGFVPAFEGTPDRIGVADKLFAARTSGFRIDFVWLIWSTIVIFVVGIRLAPELRQRPRVRTDFLLCVAAVLGCLVYLTRMLLTGMLYFG
jgi:hypothetical protein